MPTTQNDRRVRKTKKGLQDSLATLVSEKGLHTITIKELTNQADVHRSTFYAHYADIYDLYEEIENMVLSELTELIETNFSLDFNVYYQILFDYIDEHKYICKMLFSQHVANSFFDQLTLLFKNAYLKSWCIALNTAHVSEELNYLAQYHLQGCFAMIRQWTETDFSYPKEKTTALLSTVDVTLTENLAAYKKRGCP
ncbi:TetR/AcrR family transcriptional regulator [Enterococcus olivae]